MQFTPTKFSLLTINIQIYGEMDAFLKPDTEMPNLGHLFQQHRAVVDYLPLRLEECLIYIWSIIWFYDKINTRSPLIAM